MREPTLRIAAELPNAPRPSVKIARVCEILDCEDSQIRKLLDSGELEGHRVGRRGVRIYLDSVTSYQERQTREPKTVSKMPRPKRKTRAGLAAHLEAVATLRKYGCHED